MRGLWETTSQDPRERSHGHRSFRDDRRRKGHPVSSRTPQVLRMVLMGT